MAVWLSRYLIIFSISCRGVEEVPVNSQNSCIWRHNRLHRTSYQAVGTCFSHSSQNSGEKRWRIFISVLTPNVRPFILLKDER